MPWIALALTVGLFVVHAGANLLSRHTRFPPETTHYILQGLGGALLATCLMFFLLKAAKSFWKSIAIAALVFWILEQAEIAVCPLLVDDMAKVPYGIGLCTYATGIPIGKALTWIEGAFFVLAIGAGIGSYLFGKRDED